MMLSNSTHERVMEALHGSLDDWLALLASRPGAIGDLLAAPAAEQEGRGYGHTLREICQQPVTWLETASRMAGRAALVEAALSGVNGAAPGALVLTGSGSSLYAGECLALAL